MTAPHDIDAERAVLGSVLLSPPVLGPIQLDGGLRADDFYSDRHQRIFAAILTLDSASRPIDQFTVSADLAADNGDPCDTYLAELLGSVPILAHVREYAKIVKDRSVAREQLQAAREIQAAALNLDIEEPIRVARGMLTSDHGAVEVIGEERILEIAVAMSEATEDAERFEMPWPVFNEAIGGGLRRGNLLVLGAWPSDGKSIAVDQICAHVCPKGGPRRAAVYLGEMDVDERVERLVARHSDLPFYRARRRPWSADDTRKAMKLQVPRIDYIPAPRWKIDRVCQHALRNRYDVVVIDTIRNFDLEPREYGGLVQATEEALSKLVGLGKQADCLVIVVVHLSRPDVKDGKNPRPNAKHIRWGQAAEMDADALMFIYRERDDNNLRTLNAELYVEKGRSIPPASVDLRLDPDRMSFYEGGDDEW